MGIRKNYINEMTSVLSRMNPSLDKDDIEKLITSRVKEKMQDPSIEMDNNVTGKHDSISLSKLCQWIDDKKPVVSGNATFYMQPEVLESPTSYMLKSLKLGRKQVKKEMFQYHPDSDEYAQADLTQLNMKIIMNAEYGGSGAPTAAFYTKYSPAATTLMAQSIITTMAAFFEGYIGDNQKFYSIAECVDWMEAVCRKDGDIPKWIDVPSVTEVQKRIQSHCYPLDIRDIPIIERYLKSRTDKELVYLYYTNNMKELISKHSNVSSLIHSVLSTLPLLEAQEKEVPSIYRDKFEHVDQYNKWVAKEMFLNPYEFPPSVEKDLKKLIQLIHDFCYVSYLTPDSIRKLNNHTRNTVLLVDTDSNMLNADIFASFVLDELFPNETFGRSRLYNDMICVNMMAAIIDICVRELLDYYGRCHNMNEDARKELTMKNEFLFRILFMMMKKKRYGASIVLREGNIMVPFKLEIKGVDFIKAGVSDAVTDRFTQIFRDYILFADTIDLHGMMREIKKFEKEIYQDLRQGGVHYLKPQSFKAEAAYKERWDKTSGKMVNVAWSLPVFRGAMVWNELYPLKRIYSLDRVRVANLIITSPEDLIRIKDKYPEEYQLVMDKVFHSDNPNIVKSGLKVIAIPSTVDRIPEWITEIIDYDAMVSSVISSYRSILDALQLTSPSIKTPNGHAKIISPLIAI